MTEPASALNIVELFLAADWVVKTVMVGLAIASLWSWMIIINKAVRFASLNASANSFERAIASGRSLEDLAAQAGNAAAALSMAAHASAASPYGTCSMTFL